MGKQVSSEEREKAKKQASFEHKQAQISGMCDSRVVKRIRKRRKKVLEKRYGKG